MMPNSQGRGRAFWSRALAALLPRSLYEGIIALGVVCGVGYYMAARDSWLLATFLGMLAGSRMAPKSGGRRTPRVPPAVPGDTP